MSEQEIQQQQIVSDFINSYEKFKTIEDIPDIIHNIVIPNFQVLACELGEIINAINTKYSVQSESMDFIELVFNPNLYQVINEQMDKSKDRFTHWSIALVEFAKLDQYNQITNRLKTILSDEKISNMILTDGILQASNERIANCKEKLKQIYWDLEKNYPTFTASKYAVNILFEANNFEL